jgi:hypothetical protein
MLGFGKKKSEVRGSNADWVKAIGVGSGGLLFGSVILRPFTTS